MVTRSFPYPTPEIHQCTINKTVVISISVQTTAFDPAAPSVDRPPPSLRTIHKRVNQYIHDIDEAGQLDHLRTLQLQGCWLIYLSILGSSLLLCRTHDRTSHKAAWKKGRLSVRKTSPEE